MVIKDVIESRLMQHIQVLKDEIKHAKKIIGDPKSRDRVIKDLNFERVVIKKNEKPQTEAERNFNTNVIKIYPKVNSQRKKRQHQSLNF